MNRFRRSAIAGSAALGFAIAVTPFAVAQSTQGLITGTITDATGAAVPNAMVSVTSAGTGIAIQTKSDSSGQFRVLNLVPGLYSVHIDAEGFESVDLEHLQLQSRQQLRSDVKLTPGSVSQKVTVDASSAGVIETETPSISAALDSADVKQLPANYRASASGTSPITLIQALPGVQPDTAANNGTGAAFSVQGGLPFQTEVSVDGITSQSATSNTPLSNAFISGESIQELRVDGVLNNAQFGQPGEVTTISKSGTNHVHGGIFEYHQNAAFDAIPFGADSKPELIGNDFGGTVGGPVVIPHLYNGHDRSFFFGTYEGFRLPQSTPEQYSVPTVLMKQGNFNYPEVKPLQNPFVPRHDLRKQYASRHQPRRAEVSAILPRSQPWGYDRIPGRHAQLLHEQEFQPELEPVRYPRRSVLRPEGPRIRAIQLEELLDRVAGAAAGAEQHRCNPGPHLRHRRQLQLQPVDHQRVPLRIYLRNHRRHQRVQRAVFRHIDGPAGSAEPLLQRHSRAGLLQALFAQRRPPYLADQVAYTRQYLDTLSWQLGQHNIKFGVDFRQVEAITPLSFQGADNYGTFDFSTAQFTGTEFADFLLGIPNTTDYDVVQSDNDGKSFYSNAFAQDEWHASRRLVLSYGLRYEFHPAYNDPSGNIGNFDPSVPKSGRVVYPRQWRENARAKLSQQLQRMHDRQHLRFSCGQRC